MLDDDNDNVPNKFSPYNSRTFCDVLYEARKIIKYLNDHNIGHQQQILFSLIEELQVIGNRMEAGLTIKHDLQRGTEQLSNLKRLCKEERSELIRLKNETRKERTRQGNK